MNNEFKKIKQQNNITRYVLETATAGSTSAAMVPTMDKSVGEVQARVPQKPRQGPLKPQTGGGAHRDKKKEQKSGQEKHRKPFVEHGVAEGLDQEPDHEISMASNELKSIINDAKKLLMIVQRISEMEGLEAWQQSKITKATDYISSVLRTLQGENSVVEANNNIEWKKYDHESEFIKQIPREYQDPIDSADGTKAEFYDKNDQQIGIFVRADFRDHDGPGTGAYWGPTANMAEGFADIAAYSFEIGEKVEYDRSIWTIIDKNQADDTLTIARDIETVDALKVGKVHKDLEEKMQGMNEGEKKGLYYYVNKRKKAGTSRPKSHPKAPSEQDWKNAAKTAKNESKEVYLDTLFEKLQSKLK